MCIRVCSIFGIVIVVGTKILFGSAKMYLFKVVMLKLILLSAGKENYMSFYSYQRFANLATNHK